MSSRINLTSSADGSDSSVAGFTYALREAGDDSGRAVALRY